MCCEVFSEWLSCGSSATMSTDSDPRVSDSGQTVAERTESGSARGGLFILTSFWLHAVHDMRVLIREKVGRI